MPDLDPRLDAPIAPALADAMEAFAAAAMRARAVDPVTTELVRLRCAGYHDCRICGSLRLEDARRAGVDEEMTAKVAVYESSDLPEHVKAALRLTDAVIIDPGGADRELAAQVRRHFSDEQIAELLLDVVKWSRQKERVALRLEAPPWQGTNALRFDAEGNHVLGAARAARASTELERRG
jgi:AhpD family alkylhydroperoxidase